MAKIKSFKEVDKIEELGNKICRLVEYYDREKGMEGWELATIADVLVSIREIFKSYDERFKKLEAELGIYTDPN